jgi:hypothetical protein
VTNQSASGQLLLFHLELVEKGPREKRLRALRSLPDRYKQIIIAVTEATNRDWEAALVDQVDNDALFFTDPKDLAGLYRSP